MSYASKLNLKSMFFQVLFFILGIGCYVLALRLFFVDNHIAAGGFSGIATILNYLVPVPIGTLIFYMNCPLVLIAIKVMGWRYALKTLLAMSAFSLALNLAASIPVATGDRFVASVFGGILYALGAVALLHAKASTGGTDLVSRLLLRRFRQLSLGRMFLLIDGFCVVLAVIVYGNLESGVYALTAIVVFSYSTDRIISGFNVADVCYVITNQNPDEMGKEIMHCLRVGVTLQEGVGMFENTRRYIMMIVVRPREIHRLKTIIQKHDPRAFLVVAWASEVMGGGFKTMSDQS